MEESNTAEKTHPPVLKVAVGALVVLAAVLIVSLVLSGTKMPDDPEGLVALLGGPSEDKASRAKEALERLQNRAVPALEAGLQSEDKAVRLGCIGVLANIRNSKALLAVGALVDNPDKEIRLEAIGAAATLASVWKEKAVEVLGRAFEQNDEESIKKAAAGLRDMDYPKATAALLEAFEGEESLQSVYAARMLHEMSASDQAAGKLVGWLSSGDAAIAAAATTSVKELKEALVPELVRAGGTQADTVLHELCGALFKELEETLDSKRAAVIHEALGMIADDKCVEKMIGDFESSSKESRWRLAAAKALGQAAAEGRANPKLQRKIVSCLASMLENEDEDDIRIKIGAAIALCRLREVKGVRFLLDVLNKFQQDIETETDKGKLRDLAELRIRAQEALTASGDFVVPFLRAKMDEKDAGPYIIWAAAKTMGELGVRDDIHTLGRYVTEMKRPEVAFGEDGALSHQVELENWSNPDEAAVKSWQEKLEVFNYPAQVRLTAAIALGQLGGDDALDALKRAEGAESDLLQRIEKNAAQRNFHTRAPVINAFKRSHENILFYLRRALKHCTEAGAARGRAPYSTGS